MSRRKILIVILVIFEIALGNSYYVSFNSGKDSNTGLNKDVCWRFCPGMPGWNGTGKLQAGDTIYFNNLEKWEVSSGFSALQIVGGVVYDGKKWGNGNRAKIMATGDLDGSVVNIMEDHLVYMTVVRGFDIDVNNKVTSGLSVNWPRAQKNLNGATKRFEDCIVHGVVSHQSSDEYEYGINIDCGYGGGRSLSNVEIINCVAFNISRGGINVYPANDDPKGIISNVLIRGCEVYNCGTDPDFGGHSVALKNHSKNVVFEYNYIHNGLAMGGIGIGCDDSTFSSLEQGVIRYNIITECKSAGIDISGDVKNMDVDIYGNLFLKNSENGISINSYPGSNFSLGIYNNTFFEDGSSELIVQSDRTNVLKLELINNIFYANNYNFCIEDVDEKIMVHSNNIYHRKGGDAPVQIGNTRYSSGNISSWESTAKTTDILFTDTSTLPMGFSGTYGADLKPSTDGLSVSVNSLAVNNGANLGAKYNNSINSVERPSEGNWDIGAYEHASATSIIKKKENSNFKQMSQIKILLCKHETYYGQYDVYTLDGRIIEKYSSSQFSNNQMKDLNRSRVFSQMHVLIRRKKL
jgi:hypothetical protein